MGRYDRVGVLLGLGLALEGLLGPGWVAREVRAKVVERERDVTITGPRGRSIERSITSERGPGFVDRQVNIQRPGGTFHSNAMAVRPGAAGGFGPPVRFGPWGPGPRPFVGREVIINNGGGPGSWLAPLAIGGGLFGLGVFAGSALASPPPPPPVAPMYVAPVAPIVGGQPGVVYQPVQPGQPVVPVQPSVDAVALEVQRFQSYHAASRRDAAVTLGRLRDPRAIPALVDRLRHDNDTEVRVAAATAMGEIGDPSARVYLERVTIYDKKQKVRDAAALALTRMPQEAAMAPAPGQAPYQQGQLPPPPVTSTPAGTPSLPSLAPIPSNVPPPPSAELEERVPPPPTPSTSTAGPGFSGQP